MGHRLCQFDEKYTGLEVTDIILHNIDPFKSLLSVRYTILFIYIYIYIYIYISIDIN